MRSPTEIRKELSETLEQFPSAYDSAKQSAILEVLLDIRYMLGEILTEIHNK